MNQRKSAAPRRRAARRGGRRSRRRRTSVDPMGPPIGPRPPEDRERPAGAVIPVGAGRLKTSQAGGSARKVAGGVGLPKLVTEKFGPRYARSMSEVVSKMGKIPAQMDTT